MTRSPAFSFRPRVFNNYYFRLTTESSNINRRHEDATLNIDGVRFYECKGGLTGKFYGEWNVCPGAYMPINNLVLKSIKQGTKWRAKILFSLGFLLYLVTIPIYNSCKNWIFSFDLFKNRNNTVFCTQYTVYYRLLVTKIVSSIFSPIVSLTKYYQY